MIERLQRAEQLGRPITLEPGEVRQLVGLIDDLENGDQFPWCDEP